MKLSHFEKKAKLSTGWTEARNFTRKLRLLDLNSTVHREKVIEKEKSPHFSPTNQRLLALLEYSNCTTTIVRLAV